MTNSIPLSDLESSPSAKFETLGQAYAGRILAMVERQQTDTTGRALSFDDGQPRMQWVLTIEQSSGEHVALYAKGGNFKAATGTGASMLSAIGAAVRAAGANAVEVGAEIAVAYTGNAEAQPGKSPAKLYTAQYKAATAQVPVDLFTQS